MSKKNKIISLILNAINFILVLICAIYPQTEAEAKLLDDSGVESFKYFTFDSNLLLGLASLILVIFLIVSLIKKEDVMPKWLMYFKGIAVNATSLTFIVVIVFLTPVYMIALKDASVFLLLYANRNFFFHLFCPLLGFISFAFFEKEVALEKKLLFLGLIPMALYSIFYVIVIVAQIFPDFYGFTFGGRFYLTPISIILVASLNFLMGYFAYRLRGRK